METDCMEVVLSTWVVRSLYRAVRLLWDERTIAAPM